MAPGISKVSVSLHPLLTDDFSVRLGEILHSCIEYLCQQGLTSFDSSHPLAEVLVQRAFRAYTHPFPEGEEISVKASTVLQGFLANSKILRELKELFEQFDEIVVEPEVYQAKNKEFLRPDLLLLADKALALIEIKLRESDFKREQVENYVSVLRDIFAEKEVRAYLLTLDPPKLKKITLSLREDDKKLSPNTQLSLFG